MGFHNSSCSKWSLAFIFFKILKQLCVFFPHVFFMLPCSIFRTVAVPLNLYHPYGLVPEHFEFLVQDVYLFHLKIPFVLHLDHIPIMVDFKDGNLFKNVETLANISNPSYANYKYLAIFL
jgi:hypothetical protein